MNTVRKLTSPFPGSARRCPRCKSTKVGKASFLDTGFYAREISFCGNCAAVWEPLNEALVWDVTDLHCSFREPCDNCAFRPGAPEQQDTEKWRDLMAKLRAGGSFYCHKGVPIDPSSEDGFAYPRNDAGQPNTKRLRLCRGYLNALGKWWKAPAGTDLAPDAAPPTMASRLGIHGSAP